MRILTNKPGTVYDASKTHIFYAEDWNALSALSSSLTDEQTADIIAGAPTGQQVIKSLTIPGGTLDDGDIIEFDFVFSSQSTNAITKYCYVMANNNTGLTGQVICNFWQQGNSANALLYGRLIGTLKVKSDLSGTLWGLYQAGGNPISGQMTGVHTSNFNLANDIYLNAVVARNGTNTEIKLKYANIKVTKA